MKTIEELCKKAFTDATGIYENVSVNDWWSEFKMQNDIPVNEDIEMHYHKQWDKWQEVITIVLGGTPAGDYAEQIMTLISIFTISEKKEVPVGEDVDKAAENIIIKDGIIHWLQMTVISPLQNMILEQDKWELLSKISDDPKKWLEIYCDYLELSTQQDTAAWWQEQFNIANAERNELKAKESRVEMATKVIGCKEEHCMCGYLTPQAKFCQSAIKETILDHVPLKNYAALCGLLDEKNKEIFRLKKQVSNVSEDKIYSNGYNDGFEKGQEFEKQHLKHINEESKIDKAIEWCDNEIKQLNFEYKDGLSIFDSKQNFIKIKIFLQSLIRQYNQI